MAVIPGDVVRVIATQQDRNGSAIQNVFFFLHEGTSDCTNPAFMTAVETFISGCYGNMSTWIPSTCDPVTIKADVVWFVSGKLESKRPVGEVQWTTWGGGSGTGEGLPQGCAALLSFPANLVPGVQGRKYVGPLVEAAQDDGELVSSCQTSLADFATDLLTGFLVSAEDFLYVIMSSKEAEAVGTLVGIVKAVVAYQRRRKSGVGA